MTNSVAVATALDRVPANSSVQVKLASGQVVTATAITPITQANVGVSYLKERGEWVTFHSMPKETGKDTTLRRKNNRPIPEIIESEIYHFKSINVDINSFGYKGTDGTTVSLGEVDDPLFNEAERKAIAIINTGETNAQWFAFVRFQNDLIRKGQNATTYQDYFLKPHVEIPQDLLIGWSWKGFDAIVSRATYVPVSIFNLITNVNNPQLIDYSANFSQDTGLVGIGFRTYSSSIIPVSTQVGETIADTWEANGAFTPNPPDTIIQSYSGSRIRTETQQNVKSYLNTDTYTAINTTLNDAASASFTALVDFTVISGRFYISFSGSGQRTITESENYADNSYSRNETTQINYTQGNSLPNQGSYALSKNLTITLNSDELIWQGENCKLSSAGFFESTISLDENREPRFYDAGSIDDNPVIPAELAISALVRNRCQNWARPNSLITVSEAKDYTIQPATNGGLEIPPPDSLIQSINCEYGLDLVEINTNSFFLAFSNLAATRTLLDSASIGASFVIDVSGGNATRIGKSNYLGKNYQVPLVYTRTEADIDPQTGNFTWPPTAGVDAFRSDGEFNAVWGLLTSGDTAIDIFWYSPTSNAYKRLEAVLTSVTFLDTDLGESGIARQIQSATVEIASEIAVNEPHIGGEGIVSQANYWAAIDTVFVPSLSTFYLANGVPTILTTRATQLLSSSQVLFAEVLQLDTVSGIWERKPTVSGIGTAINRTIAATTGISAYFDFPG